MADAPLPDSLLAGYTRFRAGRYPQEADRYRRLGREGQAPQTMVVACSDSRSGPELVFDAGPGELFIVRNVAALVPVYAPDAGSHAASAALEFAVLALGVTTILVMGHGRCGGVAAASDDAGPLTATDFIGRWVAPIRDLQPLLAPADVAEPGRRRTRLEHLTVEQSLVNLRTFPWVRAREADGSLALCGTWFDISLGELHALGAHGWERVEAGA
ncbi:MAG TPA: carbonic anhydrase [Gaiellaceae bacterium]|nr:carbonic anhydrase [Gaiellaceae bacterium]